MSVHLDRWVATVLSALVHHHVSIIGSEFQKVESIKA